MQVLIITKHYSWSFGWRKNLKTYGSPKLKQDWKPLTSTNAYQKATKHFQNKSGQIPYVTPTKDLKEYPLALAYSCG